MKKIGIYVQVPFCQTKGTYCNFHTGVVSAERFAPYVRAVWGEIRGHRELDAAAGIGGLHEEKEVKEIKEVKEVKERTQARESSDCFVDTVYFGGGRLVCWRWRIWLGFWTSFEEVRSGEWRVARFRRLRWRRIRRRLPWRRRRVGLRRGLTGLVLGCSRLWMGSWRRRGECTGGGIFTGRSGFCGGRELGILVLI